MTAADRHPSPLCDDPERGRGKGRHCPRCAALCEYDGWDFVHQNGIGIGSCGAQRERPITADFYKCPSTGDWVYRWSDQRLTLRQEPWPDDGEVQQRPERRP